MSIPPRPSEQIRLLRQVEHLRQTVADQQTEIDSLGAAVKAERDTRYDIERAIRDPEARRLAWTLLQERELRLIEKTNRERAEMELAEVRAKLAEAQQARKEPR